MTQSILVEDNETIIHETQIHVGCGTLPHRIVLRDLGDKFVTHVETLTVTMPNESEVVFKHRSFENGHYFEHGQFAAGTSREQRLEQALKDFHERGSKF
jgi:hypothetical protein